MINALLGVVLMMASGAPTTPSIPKESAILIEEPASAPKNRRERRQAKKRQTRR